MSEYDDQVASFKSLLETAGRSKLPLQQLAEQLAEQCEILPAGTFKMFALDARRTAIALDARNVEVAKMRQTFTLEYQKAMKAEAAARDAERRANDRVLTTVTKYNTNASGDITEAETWKTKASLLLAR